MVPKTHFKHLKVIEIASVLAGPSVGLFFAEMGAEVIKIENSKSNGDVTRSWKLPNENKADNYSAYFAAVNWNKKSIFMDFNDKSQFQNLIELIREADILIVNFKLGDAEKFQLDYPTLKKHNRRLIYGEINGFGSSSDRVAYDLILQAESGFMSMNMPVALIDLIAGHQLKIGILTALYERDLGKSNGQKVSVSLYDSAIASLANQATNWLMNKHNPVQMGSMHPNIAPYGELFKTRDNVLLTFAIGSNKQFKNLCQILNLEQLIDDSRFENNHSRVSNRLSLSSYLSEAVSNQNAFDLIEKLACNFVPVARIKSIKEVFDSKMAQDLILHEEIDGRSTKRVKTAVFKIENE